MNRRLKVFYLPFRQFMEDWLGCGYRGAMALHRAGQKQGEDAVFPWYGMNALLRRGTSDRDVARQVFSENTLAIPSIVHNLAINARYHAMLDAGRMPVVIDAGANIGLSTIWYRWMYPQAHIVAIEPDPGNAAQLRRNISGMDCCTILEAAVGSSTGHVAMIDMGSEWMVRTQRAEAGVELVTIGEILGNIPDYGLLVVKVDIEGFESDLFAGKCSWIDEAETILIEPHEWLLPGQRTSSEFQRQMAVRDFALFSHADTLTYIRNRPGEDFADRDAGAMADVEWSAGSRPANAG